MAQDFTITFLNNQIYELLDIIENNYNDYDSFIVIHGTDTIAYTASFLSFSLENLNKPIIITGAIAPLYIMLNDSFNNLLGALTIAGHFNIPEVLIFMQGKLFRGNRVIKIDSQHLDCLQSPNYPIIAQIGVDIQVNWGLVFQQDASKPLNICKNVYNSNIALIKYYPLYPNKSIQQILLTPKLQGLVIEAYGQGYLPEDKELKQILKDGSNRGIYIIIISQCQKNFNSELIAAQLKKFDQDIIYGGDMTASAAIAKLSYLLAKNYEGQEINQLMSQNLRGEISISQDQQKFENNFYLENLIGYFSQSLGSNQMYINAIRNTIIPNFACFFSKLGYMEHLEQLKQMQTNFNTCHDYDRRTPLHIACRSEQESVVKLLIEQGANVNAIDSMSRSPLYEAIIKKNKNIASMLRNKGALIYANQEEITNNLMQAAADNDFLLLQMFYYAGLKNLNEYHNIDRRNIGHIAVAKNNKDLVNFLKFTTNFDFTQKDRWNKMPIDYAIENNYTAIVLLLQQ